MAAPQQQISRSNHRVWGAFILACLFFVAGEALFAQNATSPNAVAIPVPQTNAPPPELTPAYTGPETTNPPAAFTNNLQNYVLPAAPAPFAEAPEANIGTGQLPSPIVGRSALTGAPPGAPQQIGAGALWQSGEVAIHAQVNETVTYGNGLEFTPGSQASTLVSQFSPGVVLQAGGHWLLNFTPTIVAYSSDKFHDTVNEMENLTGSTTYEDWRFGLSQSYTKISQPLVETGEQTSSELVDVLLNASRSLSSDFSMSMSADMNYRTTEGFNNVEGWTGAATLSYSPVTQLSFNLNLSGGYDFISDSSDLIFESVQGGLTFRPRNRLKLTLSAGGEELQFVHPHAPSLFSPVFSAAISYQATASTLLTLNAGETVSPSFYANEVVTETSLAVMIQQQLSRKFALSLAGNYTTVPFTSVEPGAPPPYFLGAPTTTTLVTVRDDTTESLTARLSYIITHRLSSSIFYTLSQNASGNANFNYTSLQEGITLSYYY
jgi:hypothetical protein